MKYDEINFGKATGEQEGAHIPELLRMGFIDKGNVLKKLRDEDRFLVLGYKGSGKSTIAEKIRLESFPEDQTSKYIAKIQHLGDFPFKSFAKIFSGQAEPEAKYPSTWSYLINLLIIGSLVKDAAFYYSENNGFREKVERLQQLGLLPTEDLKQLVVKSSKSSFKVQLPKVIEYMREDKTEIKDNDLLFLHIIESLNDMIKGFIATKKHLIVLDGLDDVLTTRELQYTSLSALVYEVNKINYAFARDRTNVKIIVLCRSELYERLPGPNKNKIKQDSAIVLDWYHDPRDPENSMLVRLANLRAGIAVKGEIDIFSTYFPNTFNEKVIAHFLLDNTRHTPRDFLQLLANLQPFYQGNKFSRSNILSGLRHYSLEYFMPEIKDEVVGYVEFEKFEQFVSLLNIAKLREFKLDLLDRISKENSILDLTTIVEILEALYDCSAIGCKWQNDRYEFKFRNRNSSFNKEVTIVLHHGLWKSLNLV
ncbi:P-loop ATPase, Sll1717 family [Geomonas paludis]|uniref:Orc1-like AAA ATPase domain-containing protein n=1 Tax=Geomonas paludis TaxID=2740185 RepID=A0A6V8MRE4_9BACT|nr:hypothetical protein [Geomonas paludis]GFO62685.1 hypothetical protein GMPD_06040 [Geomonas paludis]